MVSRAVELGMPAIAITDHGVLYGVIDFYREARKQGIKPIIGCEVYVAPRSRLDKEPRRDDNQYHLVLLCKNKEGYQNLIQLVSRSYIEGFYYKPRVDRELLSQYSAGLVAMSACVAGEIPQAVLAGDYVRARQLAEEYNQIFGPGNFYLELQDHGMSEEKKVCEALCRISDETGIPLVASNDIHYIRKTDAPYQDVLLCIQTGTVVSDEQRMRFPPGAAFYMKSAEEMAELFSYRPEAIKNTLELADKCSMEFEFGEFHLPYFDVPEGYTAETYLSELAWDKFRQKYPGAQEELVQRMAFELKTIINMGFAAYFLNRSGSGQLGQVP